MKRSIPWKWHFPPWYWWIFPWLNRHSFMTHSSNFGTMTQLIHHPLSPYILSFTQWVKCSPLLSSLFTLVTPFPVLHYHFFSWLCYCAYWGCTSWLISDSFLTHNILHTGRIFQQQHHNHIICLVIETTLHVYKGQFCPWLGQFISCIHLSLSLLQSKYSLSAWPPDFVCFGHVQTLGYLLTILGHQMLTSSISRTNCHLGNIISSSSFAYSRYTWVCGVYWDLGKKNVSQTTEWPTLQYIGIGSLDY